MQPTLGGDHHPLASRVFAAAFQRTGDEPLALAVGPIHIGRVEVVDTQFEAGIDCCNAMIVGCAGAGHAGQRPAA